MSTVSVRPATPADGRFIADSWLKSFKGAPYSKFLSPEVYWDQHRRVVSRLVERSETLVLCDPQDPWTIFAWGCFERDGSHLIVHYVYVKEPFRSLDLATRLVEEMAGRRETTALLWTHGTRQGRNLAEHLAAEVFSDIPVVYNPYLMHERHG